ncbi:MAG: hypothetical protein IID35_06385 [Planctomycetes bacterium]|nr:hypothetical protein [Planctomycetota bacterium]
MVVESNRRAPGCKLRSETFKLVSRKTIKDKDLGGRGNNDRPRSVDVYAATDDVSVLSLSDGAIRRMINEDPAVAAKVLLNLSRMLCVRLIKANRLSDTLKAHFGGAA